MSSVIPGHRSLTCFLVILFSALWNAGCSTTPVKTTESGPYQNASKNKPGEQVSNEQYSNDKVPLAPQTQNEAVADITRDELGVTPPATPVPAKPAPDPVTEVQKAARQKAAVQPEPVARPAPAKQPADLPDLSTPKPLATQKQQATRQPPEKARVPVSSAPEKSPPAKPEPVSDARKPIKQQPLAAPTDEPAPAPEKATPAPVEPEPLTAEITLEDLPVKVQNWLVDRPPAGQSDCLLKTSPMQIEDGAGGTPLVLEFNKDSLVVATRSNIDLTYENSQITIGDDAYAFEFLDNETNAVIRNGLPRVINALDNARIASVTLGFWPSWPKTTLYELQVPVAGFTQAYHAWQSCNRLL